MYELLERTSTPADVRALRQDGLKKLAGELRSFVHETVSRVGGHLSSNLGSIELTVALLHVFEPPRDKIVWDVGHQAYAYKVLTGRRERLETVRRKGGISGFPVRAESEYDAFGTAHASTAVSAATGYATAGDKAVAVVGDGAMSGGMAFEALNNAGAMEGLDLLVVLNDNDMSISPAVGALRQNLARVLASTVYDTVRSGSAMVMPPTLREFASKAEEHLRGMVMPGTIFEELGFKYYGPVDGHDLDALVPMLSKLRNRRGPRILHVATVKGKGYAPAEDDPVKHHGVSAQAAPQKVETAGPKGPTYSKVFGDWIEHAAERDDRVRAITPAMREGSGLVGFERRFPDRYFDCGIAEQHAVTFSAGLACAGLRPVLAIYSTFLQRGYDQLIHDVAIQDLPVVFAIDRAGLVGADGATHHGAFDLTYLRCVPNMTVMVPSDESECWLMLNTALSLGSPAAVRYPRGSGPGAALPEDRDGTVEVGKARVLREGGGKLAILAFGPTVAPALKVAEELDATVADMRFAKPIDGEAVDRIAKEHSHVVTVEENVREGGAGSAVAAMLAARPKAPRVRVLGLPDRFIEHGSPAELLAEAGLDAAGIDRSVREFLGSGGKARKARKGNK